ncbi:MAG TPA: AsmA family protein [Spirochaetota bacterium]|nr:AsmA family protein [Spirochaetota bacterium]HOR43301.1 AsmA family protein [Spirochaetota bacterium]
MKHRKIIKFFLILSAASILSIGILTLLFFLFFPKDKISSMIVSKARSTLNRHIEAGKIDYSAGGIKIHSVKIHETDSAESEVMVSIKSVSVRFSLLSLLTDDFQLKKIYFNEADINIRYDNGKYNIKSLIDNMKQNSSGESASKPDIKFSDCRLNLISTEKEYIPACGIYQFGCDLSFDGEIIEADNFSVTLPESRGNIETEFIITKENDKSVISGNLNIQKLRLDWLYKIKDITGLPFVEANGKLSAFVLKDGTIEGKAEAKSQMSKGGFLEAEGRLKINFSEKNITVDNGEAVLNQSKAKVSYLNIITNGPQINFTAPSADLTLPDLFPYLDFIPSGIDGHYKGSVSYRAHKLSIEGELSNGSFLKTKNLITGVNSKISVKNNIFSHENIPFTFRNKPATISIASLDESLENIAANINISDAETDDFALLGESLGQNNSTQSKTTVKGTLSLGQMKFKKGVAEKVTLKFSKSGNTLSVPSASFSLFDALFAGEFYISDLSGKGNGNFKMRFSNLKIQKLSELDENFSDRAFGIAEGKAEGNFSLSAKNISDELNYHSEFSITNGKITNTGLQNNLGFLLDPLKHKLRDIEFNRIYGSFDAYGPRYIIRQIAFTSRDIKLSVAGDVNKDKSGNINIKLEFNNDFIADIPNIAYINLSKYKTGKWYLIPIRAKGSDITKKDNYNIVD